MTDDSMNYRDSMPRKKKKKKDNLKLDTGSVIQADGLPRNFNDLPQKERERLVAELDNNSTPEVKVQAMEEAPIVQEKALPRTPAKPVTETVEKNSRPLAVKENVEVKDTSQGKEIVKQPLEKAESAPKKGLSDTFKQAISHLAPSAVGMLVGALVDGRDGAVAGFEQGTALNSAVRDMAQQDQKMQISAQNAETQRMFAENTLRQSQSDKAKKRLSTVWVDSNNNPVIESDGVPVDKDGNQIPTSKLKRYQAELSPLEKARINKLNSTNTSSSGKVSKNDLTPGELKADQSFATDFQKWVSGGFSNTQANIAKLENVLSDIEDPNTERGNVLLPESIRARTNKASVTVEQDVGNVVFQSLKEILGGQFTEKEGQKLVQQTYDPRLSDTENAAKLRATIKSLKDMATAKQSSAQHFSDNGTLKGFGGVSSNKIQSETSQETQNRVQSLKSKLFTR